MFNSNIIPAAIGVDLGGTNMRVGIVDQEGSLVKALKKPTLAAEGKDRVIDRIVELLSDAIEISRKRFSEIMGLCIGAPGFIDIKRGIIEESPNLPDWKNIRLIDEIEKRIDLPIIMLQNDSNVFTFGEWLRGSGKGYDSIVGITLGTGVGGGLVLDRKLWLGESGMAGEIGHIVVEPSGLKCSCGRYGCLESYASGTGIVRRTIIALKKGRKTSLIDRVEGDYRSITPKIVFEEAMAGDCLCIDIMGEAGRYLGIAVASMINILDIKRFVVGGRVANAGDLILEPARKEIMKRSIRPSAREDVIVQAGLGDDAGIIGAAGIVLCEETLLSRKSSNYWHPS